MDSLYHCLVSPRWHSQLKWSHTWKQIVSTFIKHSLQEINITKLFPPKLAYFFQSMHNCQSTGSIQTAIFSFLLKTVKYQVCAKGQDCCNQKQNGLQFVNSSIVSASPDVSVYIVEKICKKICFTGKLKKKKQNKRKKKTKNKLILQVKCFPV